MPLTSAQRRILDRYTQSYPPSVLAGGAPLLAAAPDQPEGDEPDTASAMKAVSTRPNTPTVSEKGVGTPVASHPSGQVPRSKPDAEVIDVYQPDGPPRDDQQPEPDPERKPGRKRPRHG